MRRLGAARVVAAAVVALAIALPLAAVGGCNVHELGHLVTGRAAGVPVDEITWCTPANGRVAFSYQEPRWVSYAGGFSAALVLGALYGLVVLPRLASPAWWAAGVAVLGTAIAQGVVGILEGTWPTTLYVDVQDSSRASAAILIGPLAAAAAVQLGLRRLRSQPSE